MAAQTWNVSRLYFPVFARAIYNLAPEISEGGSSILLDIRGRHGEDDTREGMDGKLSAYLPTLNYAKVIKQSFASLKKNFHPRQ